MLHLLRAGSVVFTENSIRWFLPWYIDPLISGQVQLLEVHMGINGSRLEPTEVAARQYSLTIGEVYVILDIPFGSVGGHIKVSDPFPFVVNTHANAKLSCRVMFRIISTTHLIKLSRCWSCSGLTMPCTRTRDIKSSFL